MSIQWAPAALRDREAIYRYLAEETGGVTTPGRVDDAIEESATLLLQFPLSGRIGRVLGTRELLTRDVPYKLIYRVDATQVVILRVVHQTQLWPPKA